MRYNPLRRSTTPSAPKPRKPEAAPASQAPILTENPEKDGLELRFSSRPSPEVLALFHATKDLDREHQWHWHRRHHFWYAKRNDITRALATKIVAGSSNPSEQTTSIVRQNIPIAEQNPPFVNQTGPENEQPAPEDNIIPVAFIIPPTPKKVPGPVPAWKARMLRQPPTP